ncbi:hypothetical protein ACF0H5_002196 [Mactra antiquata]
MCDSLNTCASDTFPKKRLKSYHKSYWNDQLNDAHDVMWRYCEQWRATGRPRDINSTTYLNHKNAKTIFRRTHRRSVYMYLSELDRKLEEQTKSDCVGFWRQLNSRKRASRPSTGIGITFNGVTYRDREDLTEQWRQYFYTMYSPAESEQFDKIFKQHVEITVNNIFDNVTTDPQTLLSTESCPKSSFALLKK